MAALPAGGCMLLKYECLTTHCDLVNSGFSIATGVQRHVTYTIYNAKKELNVIDLRSCLDLHPVSGILPCWADPLVKVNNFLIQRSRYETSPNQSQPFARPSNPLKGCFVSLCRHVSLALCKWCIEYQLEQDYERNMD
jgi:hypothetical protein